MVVLTDAGNEGVGVHDLWKRAESVSGPFSAITYWVRGQKARLDHRFDARTGVGFILVSSMLNRTTLNLAGLGVTLALACSVFCGIMTFGVSMAPFSVRINWPLGEAIAFGGGSWR